MDKPEPNSKKLPEIRSVRVLNSATPQRVAFETPPRSSVNVHPPAAPRAHVYSAPVRQDRKVVDSSSLPPLRANAMLAGPSVEEQEEEQMKLLEEKLAAQKLRLSSPRTPQRSSVNSPNGAPHSGAMSAPQLRGRLYARPYESIAPKITWDTFDNDEEVKKLTEKFQHSVERIAQRTEEIETSWSTKRQPGASIPPPDPKVFSAEEAKLMPLILAAESFAETAHLRFLEDQGPGRSPNATPRGSLSVSTPRARQISPHSTSIDSLRLRRTSSARHAGLHIMQLLSVINMTTIDIILPSPEEVDLVRQGDILGPSKILKRDLFDAAFTRRDQVGVMSGAPYFRMMPKFNVGGVAQAHVSGIYVMLKEIRKAYPGEVLWINLRDEPLAYINGRSYIIRDENQPTVPLCIEGITSQHIEAMEAKLKAEVIREMETHGGNVCVHKEWANGAISLLWEAITKESVATLRDVFSKIQNVDGFNVAYYRMPVHILGLRPHQYDQIFDICMKHPRAPVIYNCQTGRSRSTNGMIATAVVRFYQYCTEKINLNVSMLRGDGATSNFRTLMRLVSFLPNGVLHERFVAMLAEIAGKISNLGEKIAAAFRNEPSQKSLSVLSQYAHLTCFSCYCELRLRSQTITCSFEEWIDNFSEVKLLLASLDEQGDARRLDNERIVAPFEEDTVAIEYVRNRRGHILSSNMILRCYPSEEVSVSSSVIPGILALRQFARGVPIFTCGRVHGEAFHALIDNIRESFPAIQQIHLFNVRAEPCVIINGTLYILLDYSAVKDEELATLRISADRLEDLELRLKRDVIAEAEANSGWVLVHRLHIDDNISPERIVVKKVQDPKTAHEVAAADIDFYYHRAPCPSTDSPRFDEFDQLIQSFASVTQNSAIIIHDSGGAMRTTICMNIAAMVRASFTAPLRSLQTASDVLKALTVNDEERSLTSNPFYGGIDEAETAGEAQEITLVAATQLGQMLAAGSLIATVQAIVSLGGRGRKWNILDAIDFYKTKHARETGDARHDALNSAGGSAKKYMHLLLCAIYLAECAPGFSVGLMQWCEKLPEIKNFFEKIAKHPQTLLKYTTRKLTFVDYSGRKSTWEPSESVRASIGEDLIFNRCGEVLTRCFGLKADHWPGCDKKILKPSLPGCPNFRKVKHLNVYGVAIPTIHGLYNALFVLGAYPGPLHLYPDVTEPDPQLPEAFPSSKIFSSDDAVNEKPRGRVVWVNLREEPIMYVGDRPFVFRDLQNPYANVELTGIEASSVEALEVRLKEDVLKEAGTHEGRFLVHDESKPAELMGQWEVANNDTVLTVQQVYERAVENGARVKYLRLPVTDEQSPELKDFDTLIEMILPEILADGTSDPLSVVFNCQMGRGRTTTGMVICALLVGLVFPEYYETLAKDYPKLWGPIATEFTKGNYTCIVQLKSVLSNGREAKWHVDLVLEACGKMQNLRTAIEGYKKNTESPDVTEEMRARAWRFGVQYLQRYFNLIAFTSYLHDQWDPEAKAMRSTFENWYQARGELRHLHNHAGLS